MRSKLFACAAALAATTAALTLTAAPASAKLVMFSSPTHNIGCAMTTEFARCDVGDRTWPTPSKPRGCMLDWGNGFIVGTRGRARTVCAGDTTLNPRARVLAYGRSQPMGRFTCTSRRRGMTCRNRGTRHGFTVSRTSYRAF